MTGLLTLHNPRDARRYYQAGLWKDDTLYGLLVRNAKTRAAAFGLRDSQSRLTWSEVLERVDCVANALDAAGVRPGERVSVWLPNRVEATIVFLACARNEYVCNPSLHQNFTVAEILLLLQGIQSRALFAQQGYGADAESSNVFERALQPPGMRAVFELPGDANRPATAGTRIFPSATEAVNSVSPSSDPDKVVYLAFTSGTTGSPKGVMHTDNTLLANARAMVKDCGSSHPQCFSPSVPQATTSRPSASCRPSSPDANLS